MTVRHLPVELRFPGIALLLLILAATGACSANLSDPYRIMELHYEAIGGLERLKSVTSSYSEGRVRYDGLRGTFQRWDKRPLQYRTAEDYSIISQIEGDNGEFTWFFDTNGQQLIVRDEESLKRRQISLRLDRYEHLDRRSPYFSLAFSGITPVGDRPCYEVVLTNTINSDRGHFFFDTETLHMVRSKYLQPDMEIESVYGDYRTVDGMLLPFYQHNTFHPWEKEEETWTTTYTNNQPVDAQLFLPPARERGYHFGDGGTAATVPFELIENLIYLPVTIAGETHTWVLDSGASMSVIDQDYAKRLGLDVQGSIKGYGFGELFELSFVEVPEFQVGPITFARQKLYVSQGLTEKSYEPVIAGILGYDFLSRFVVEIDYDHQTATFHAPEAFVYRGPGITIDAPLKYRTFTLPVVLDNRYSSLWSLDLGSYHSSVHYPFAEKHGLLDRPGVAIVSQGMSGISYETNVRFGCLAIDRFGLDQPLISIPVEKGKGAAALGEVGGNLGNSTLRHFHLFLNYPEQKIILEKGLHFNRAFPSDKSGMIIGRAESSQPMVSYVATASPAAKAGLRAGDMIMEMAGQPLVPGQLIAPLRTVLRGPAGSIVPLKIQREDKVFAATIILEEIYPAGDQPCLLPAN